MSELFQILKSKLPVSFPYTLEYTSREGMKSSLTITVDIDERGEVKFRDFRAVNYPLDKLEWAKEEIIKVFKEYEAPGIRPPYHYPRLPIKREVFVKLFETFG